MMNTDDYRKIRWDNGLGLFERKRGLIAVSGGEAIQFLNGLITNDVAKMDSAKWMFAAFPNAQGRLLALVRVMRFRFFSLEKDFFKEDKFIFETEWATYEKVLENLSRFTMAGDFHVEDLTEKYSFMSLRGSIFKSPPYSYKKNLNAVKVARDIDETGCFYIQSFRHNGLDFFVPRDKKEDFLRKWKKQGAIELDEEVQEVMRIEEGLPLYGVDMDETTIVPELGIENLISYEKGCYIGQEVIARIHFRGHIAKQFTGISFLPQDAPIKPGDELKSPDGKNAGRITSVTFSPGVNTTIALGYVRYNYLDGKTELQIGDSKGWVGTLPYRR